MRCGDSPWSPARSWSTLKSRSWSDALATPIAHTNAECRPFFPALHLLTANQEPVGVARAFDLVFDVRVSFVLYRHRYSCALNYSLPPAICALNGARR